MHRALKNALAKSALLKGASTLGDLELGLTFGTRCLSTSTDLKAVLAEKIPAEQVGSYFIFLPLCPSSLAKPNASSSRITICVHCLRNLFRKKTRNE